MTDGNSTRSLPNQPTELVRRYRLGPDPLFMIGAMDTGVTVLAQQTRALNFVWALVNTDMLTTDPAAERQHIAIVGAGFAGLTVAAAMINKGVVADVTIFERRDTAIPLQLGSDTRWVHPHIYDWPAPGSEAFSASLPLLNWTASRASDVVVQVLNEWNATAKFADTAPAFTQLTFFCNTQHLQVSRPDPGHPGSTLQIEWVGEPRDPTDPSVPVPGERPGGHSAPFDLVVLATGFGVEGSQPSYWRNEQLAQPHLGHATVTYIVSGAGDGALIDLFRLRIARFRQDRILSELFQEHDDLFLRLRDLDASIYVDAAARFTGFDDVWNDPALVGSTTAVRDMLANRLRRDTRVILHVTQNRFADLFARGRVSFQNRMLLFLLYKVGGFHPSTNTIKSIAAEHQVRREHIIERHGLTLGAPMRAVLSDELQVAVDDAAESPDEARQPDEPMWTGGYFSYYEAAPSADDEDLVRARWRKEYLPGPTQAIATAFCSGLAGYLAADHPRDSRLRVTLHRTLRLGAETVLQQCCEYQGLALDKEPGQSAGRTFPAANGTIGVAFTHRKVVRSADQARSTDIQHAMEEVALNVASRQMSQQVEAVMAAPLLGTGSDGRETVIGVLYVDSYQPNFFSDTGRMTTMIGMTQQFLNSALELSANGSGHLANNNFWLGRTAARPINTPAIPGHLVDDPTPPCREPQLGYINFDFSDFTKVNRS